MLKNDFSKLNFKFCSCFLLFETIIFVKIELMIVWIIFIATIVLFLALDLGVFNKTPHIISSKEAGIWTAVWVTLSFAFSGVVNWLYSNQYIANPTGIKPSVATIKYITGYLIELSLSIDNIFIIAVIFTSFKISQKYQHSVLFWGILGAIIFRGLMIFFGVILINKFSWMKYLFGAFLLFTAFKMLFKKEESDFEPKESLVYRIIGKVIPITSHTEKKHFFIKVNNVNHATPLFVALLVFAEVCPSKVRPVIIKSGREFAKAASTKKYSCSQPKVAVTFLTLLSKYLQTSVAASSTAFKARKSGVL